MISHNITHSNSKLDKVYAYMLRNFNTGISQNQVAEQIKMSPSASSRFLNSARNKKYINFLTGLRIGFA